MKHTDLPSRWVEKLKTYIREELKQDRDKLGATDFHHCVKIHFPDGSFALFQYAFYLLDREHNEVAVFTEHCGYHLFPHVDLDIELIKGRKRVDKYIYGIEELLELALYRALRGEISPGVRAITADLSARPIHLHIFHRDSDLDEKYFEEVIGSEMEQGLPAEFPKSRAILTCFFHEADEFDDSAVQRVLYRNHHV